MFQTEKEYADDTAAMFCILNSAEGNILNFSFSFEYWDDPEAGLITGEQCTKGLALKDVSPRMRSLLYFARGRGYLRLRQLNTAASDFKQALAINSDSSQLTKISIGETYRQFGIKMLDEGDKKSAIQAFSQAIELLPPRSLNYLNRGLAYFVLAQESGNLEDFHQAYLDLSKWKEMASAEDLQKGQNLLPIIAQLQSEFGPSNAIESEPTEPKKEPEKKKGFLSKLFGG